MPDVSSGYSYVDANLDGSEQSLDKEFGIPAVKTPRVRVAYDAANVRRSGRNKTFVQIFTYDGICCSP